MAFQIDEGHYRDVSLDGVIVAATFYFPRAIHHGGGHMQPIFRPETTEEQQAAIFAIMGGEGQPVGTVFQIFSVIVDTIHEPQFLPVEFKWDIKKHRGRLHVPDVTCVSQHTGFAAFPPRRPMQGQPTAAAIQPRQLRRIFRCHGIGPGDVSDQQIRARQSAFDVLKIVGCRNVGFAQFLQQLQPGIVHIVSG